MRESVILVLVLAFFLVVIIAAAARRYRSRIDIATGKALDLLARDWGFQRMHGETDEKLRARMRRWIADGWRGVQSLAVVALLASSTLTSVGCVGAGDDGDPAPDAAQPEAALVWCPLDDRAECAALEGEMCRADNCLAWTPETGDFCVTGNTYPPAQDDLHDPDNDGYAVVADSWLTLLYVVECPHGGGVPYPGP